MNQRRETIFVSVRPSDPDTMTITTRADIASSSGNKMKRTVPWIPGFNDDITYHLKGVFLVLVFVASGGTRKESVKRDAGKIVNQSSICQNEMYGVRITA